MPFTVMKKVFFQYTRRSITGRNATFSSSPGGPATNNLAEKNLKCLKLKQKILGHFRTIAGTHYVAPLRSILETARKLRWNALETLEADASELREKLNQQCPFKTLN